MKGPPPPAEVAAKYAAPPYSAQVRTSALGYYYAVGTRADLPKVQTYDFRQPVFLSEAELRRLRLLHEDFARYLSARLSLYLRMDFGVKLARLATATYSSFTDALANPTHLSVFRVEPLSGAGVLDVNPRLALTIADRLLPGPADHGQAGDRADDVPRRPRRGQRERPARGARLRHAPHPGARLVAVG